jgi:hypothetical protein
LGHQLAVRAQDRFHLVAGERKQPPDRSPWAPARSSSHLERRSFIPTELSFDGSQIVESGLDLDHEQGASLRVEGEQVDPAMRTPLDDLDFSRGQPPGGAQPAIDVNRALSMDEIALAIAPDDHGRPDDELDLEFERKRDPVDEGE